MFQSNKNDWILDAKKMRDDSEIKFKQLKEKADNEITSLDDKINFWLDEKVKYLASLGVYEMYISGHAGTIINVNELFLDQMISAELETLERKKKILTIEIGNSDNEPSEQIQHRVAWFWEMGIIDFLSREGYSENMMGSILGIGMAEKGDSVRVAIKRIREKGLENINGAESFIHSKRTVFKIVKKK
jgi:hypothetical protein